MLGKDTAFSLKQGNLYRDFIAFIIKVMGVNVID